MAKLLHRKDIKTKLEKQWQQGKFHVDWLQNANQEVAVRLAKPTGKQWLHHYDDVKYWLDDIQHYERLSGVVIAKQDIQYQAVGMQRLPVTIHFTHMEALARYLGRWQEWQLFLRNANLTQEQLPQLIPWLLTHITTIIQYAQSWPKLIKVCQYFIQNPNPDCYMRQLDIQGIDTKFIEQHKGVLRNLLNTLLPNEAIQHPTETLNEHGFEKRFGLRYEEPQIRFRLLDPLMYDDFSGLSDLTIPLSQFKALDILIDTVYITENKLNGLTFPSVNNAMVIFGLGYGIQALKDIRWLNRCQIYYWGDIDSHGLAMLSQWRSYYPNSRSLLMDQDTLLSCQEFWGEEPGHKQCPAAELAHLTAPELQLFHDLKSHKWQPDLRLEQERIPYDRVLTAVRSTIGFKPGVLLNSPRN
tara:strand:+ start:2835 stop:4070 length:1236 start_codon:yes stop_codon:yes gene_type:complete